MSFDAEQTFDKRLTKQSACHPAPLSRCQQGAGTRFCGYSWWDICSRALGTALTCCYRCRSRSYCCLLPLQFSWGFHQSVWFCSVFLLNTAGQPSALRSPPAFCWDSPALHRLAPPCVFHLCVTIDKRRIHCHGKRGAVMVSGASAWAGFWVISWFSRSKKYFFPLLKLWIASVS